MADLARPQLATAVLAALALAVAAWMVGRRRRARAWRAMGLAGHPPGDGSLRWTAAVAACGLALLGPRWGAAPTPELPPGHDLVLLMDVSRSMAAEDAVPDRLGAAVAGAKALVAALGRAPGERAAVVAFAGRGVLRCPLTANLGAVAEALERLRAGDVRPGGTDLAAALAAAREAFPDADPDGAPPTGRAIVVFSDGEDLEGRGASAVAALKASGIVVHAVTLGDDAPPGATVPARDPATGEPRPLTYEDRTVYTRRQDAALRAIVEATGGAFVPLGRARPEGVAALYDRAIAPAEAARREVAAREGRPERAGPLVLLALGAGLAAVGPARTRRAPVILAALALLAIGADRPPAGAREAAARGLAAFRAGRLEQALAAYEAAVAEAPGAAEPRYNAAVALDRLGRLDAADARYAEALARASGSPALRARIHFGRGNLAYRRGDADAALAHYDACLAMPAGDAESAGIRRDAAVNRAFVARRRAEPPPSGEAPPRGEAPAQPGDEPATDPAPGRTQPGAPSPSAPGSPEPAADAEPDTPEGQLDRAVDRIRRGRSRPAPDAPPPDADPARRDW